ncbi:MAG: hypothetical protein EXS39_06505 [Opitutaceae bacterium]|nr:hypothetical protein [Opitutaceae bacterium]
MNTTARLLIIILTFASSFGARSSAADSPVFGCERLANGNTLGTPPGSEPPEDRVSYGRLADLTCDSHVREARGPAGNNQPGVAL